MRIASRSTGIAHLHDALLSQKVLTIGLTLEFAYGFHLKDGNFLSAVGQIDVRLLSLHKKLV